MAANMPKRALVLSNLLRNQPPRPLSESSSSTTTTTDTKKDTRTFYQPPPTPPLHVRNPMEEKNDDDDDEDDEYDGVLVSKEEDRHMMIDATCPAMSSSLQQSLTSHHYLLPKKIEPAALSSSSSFFSSSLTAPHPPSRSSSSSGQALTSKPLKFSEWKRPTVTAAQAHLKRKLEALGGPWATAPAGSRRFPLGRPRPSAGSTPTGPRLAAAAANNNMTTTTTTFDPTTTSSLKRVRAMDQKDSPPADLMMLPTDDRAVELYVNGGSKGMELNHHGGKTATDHPPEDGAATIKNAGLRPETRLSSGDSTSSDVGQDRALDDGRSVMTPRAPPEARSMGALPSRPLAATNTTTDCDPFQLSWSELSMTNNKSKDGDSKGSERPLELSHIDHKNALTRPKLRIRSYSDSARLALDKEERRQEEGGEGIDPITHQHENRTLLHYYGGWRRPLTEPYRRFRQRLARPGGVPSFFRRRRRPKLHRHNRQQQQQRRVWLIPAEHPLKLLWDISTVALSFANAYATHIAIRDRKFGNNAFTSFCECWFVLDILLNFFTEYRTANGRVLKSYQAVWARYLTSWFVVDLLSLFPGEMIYVKPIIEAQNKRGWLKKTFFRSKAVVRVTRVLRGRHLKMFGQVARQSQRVGLGVWRLLRVMIKYLPKYILFLRTMKGVLAIRLLRQIHWIWKVVRNLFTVRRPPRPYQHHRQHHHRQALLAIPPFLRGGQPVIDDDDKDNDTGSLTDGYEYEDEEEEDDGVDHDHGGDSDEEDDAAGWEQIDDDHDREDDDDDGDPY